MKKRVLHILPRSEIFSDSLSRLTAMFPNVDYIISDSEVELQEYDYALYQSSTDFLDIDYDYISLLAELNKPLEFVNYVEGELSEVDGYELVGESFIGTKDFDGFEKLGLKLTAPGNEQSQLMPLPAGKAKSLSEFKELVKVETKPVLLLDRDGVFIEDTDYPYDPNKFIYKPEVIPLIQFFQSKGYELVILTNQAGVAKGKFKFEHIKPAMDAIISWLAENNISLNSWFASPYHSEGVVEDFARGSYRRKPFPGMILKACENIKIDLTRSLMIGDRDSDNIQLSGLRTFTFGEKASINKIGESLDEVLEYFESSGDF